MDQKDKNLQNYDSFEVDGITAHFAILTDEDDPPAARRDEPAPPGPSEPEESPAPRPAPQAEPLPDSLFSGWEDLFPPLKEEPEAAAPVELSVPEAEKPIQASEEPPFFEEAAPPAPEEAPVPVAAPRERARPIRRKKAAPDRPPQRSQRAEAADGQAAVSVAQVVADTVDAVLDERKGDQRRFEQQRHKTQRQQEKIHRSNSDRAVDAEDFSAPEPSLAEATVRQKRLFLRLRKRAIAATVLAALCWIPYIIQYFQPDLPFVPYLPYAGAALLAVLCVIGAPVFVAGFARRQVNCFTLIAIGAVAALLDTLLPISGRGDLPSMAGIAALGMALALWGECWRCGALREGFRLVALGQPAYMVDLTEHGAVKERGKAETFYNRAMKEDSATQWQRLLLPVVLLGSLVFALLSSVGRGAGGQFLWCWSAILSAGTALSLPFAYSLPYYRLAKRMGKSGSAMAGFYGARQLSYSKELLICDQDLYPPGSIRLAGVKIISEDQIKVAAYAGSLAAAFDCGWTPLLTGYMQNARAHPVRLEHFHVHEEGGISASIKGETAILGTAVLLRKMSVRLPKSLERKDALYLSVDGELVAIFALRYEPQDGVGWALHAMRRNGLTPLFTTKDPNITSKSLKAAFGNDGGGLFLDLNERLNLSQLRQESAVRPNALLYREGLAPYMEAVAGSKRLCRSVRWGGAIALFGSICGTLLAYYLIFMNRFSTLHPLQLLLFLLLWTVPVLVLAWNADKL